GWTIDEKKIDDLLKEARDLNQASADVNNAVGSFEPAGEGSQTLDLAQELEAERPGGDGPLSIEDANLGSLQRQVAEVPGMRSEAGVSPRQIAQHLDRGDEPNIRTALAAMQKRGVTELVPGGGPQR